MAKRPIGLFDSGVGGLSILNQVHHLLPNEDLIYVADQAHVPYGPRSRLEVRQFSVAITRYLLDEGAKLIVVACNTASAAALEHLRATFPDTPFVGMEPAVKPAAQRTESGKVGVLATPATFEGELFASVVARYADGVDVHQRVVPGLVERIEAGDLTGPETHRLVEDAVRPLLDEGIDTLVLGCTHYPFILPILHQLVGPEVELIDPSPAVARQVRRVLEEQDAIAPAHSPGRHTFYTTGDPARMAEAVQRFVGQPGELHALTWDSGVLSRSA
ncbi:MAG: glutamate racemase [Anaerolineales bacterium]|nr:glutamate racemase [Anaerolineales bacterium]